MPTTETESNCGLIKFVNGMNDLFDCDTNIFMFVKFEMIVLLMLIVCGVVDVDSNVFIAPPYTYRYLYLMYNGLKLSFTKNAIEW